MKKNCFTQVLKFILIYSCNNCTEEELIMLNQAAIARFLKLSRRHVIRMFNESKNMNFIAVVDKVQLKPFNRNTKKKSLWYSNVYSVDKEAINEYLKTTTGVDILANIEEESKMYIDFMTDVYIHFAEIRNESDEPITEEEKNAISTSVKQKIDKEGQRLEKLKAINSKYLNTLEELNNDSSIKMNYLNENKKRLTNTICTTKNPEKHPGSTTRMEMLHNYFDTDKNIVEFDTNASIYRLSYALGNNCVASHDVDIYELVFDACDFNIEWTKDLRDKFKQLLMPIYMREWAISYRCMQYNYQCHWKYFISKQVEQTFLFYKSLVTTLKRSLKDILTAIANAMHKIFNLDKFYKADIFIHESNLHIIMCRKFKELGIRTIDVYDGFYFIEGTMTQELYDKIYDEATVELLNDYTDIYKDV